MWTWGSKKSGPQIQLTVKRRPGVPSQAQRRDHSRTPASSSSLALQKESMPPTPLPASRDNGRQTRPSEGSHAWERPWKETQEQELGAGKLLSYSVELRPVWRGKGSASLWARAVEDGVGQKWPQGKVTEDTLSLSFSSPTGMPWPSHQESPDKIQRFRELWFTQQHPPHTTLH